MIRKILLAAMVATSLGTAAIPATSAVVYVQTAPPPMRTEVVPSARRGYVWAPGYWNWKNKKHHWVAGSWVRERRGYSYNEPRWVESNGRWSQERARWTRRDRDGDGVPDRMDRHPDNPRRN